MRQRIEVEKPENSLFYFNYNEFKITLSPEERAYISQTITYLRQHADAKLMLTGHADNSGNRSYNMDLSRQRAETMQRYFLSFGLAADRMEIAYRGANDPIESNDTRGGPGQKSPG